MDGSVLMTSLIGVINILWDVLKLQIEVDKMLLFYDFRFNINNFWFGWRCYKTWYLTIACHSWWLEGSNGCQPALFFQVNRAPG